MMKLFLNPSTHNTAANKQQQLVKNKEAHSKICLGLAYLASSKLVMRGLVQRQIQMREAFVQIRDLKVGRRRGESMHAMAKHRQGGVNLPITEVDDEREEEFDTSMLGEGNATNNDQALKLLERISGDADLRKKLDQVIGLLTSMKEGQKLPDHL